MEKGEKENQAPYDSTNCIRFKGYNLRYFYHPCPLTITKGEESVKGFRMAGFGPGVIFPQRKRGGKECNRLLWKGYKGQWL